MRRSPGRNANERGAVAVLAAFVLITIGGFLALTMNVGHMMNARAQLQGAADSAALAGAALLDGTTSGQVNAHNRALAYAVQHKLDRDTIALDANLGNSDVGDIVSGYWSTAQRRFYAPGEGLPTGETGGPVETGGSPITLSSLTPQWFNAVKVVTAADGGGGHNSQIGIFFPSFVGSTSSGVTARTTSVALGGGPCDENANVVPLVVTSCAIANGTGSNQCGIPITLRFTASGGTPAGVAFVDLSPPSEHVTRDEVETQFGKAQAHTSSVIHVLDPVAATDGEDFPESTITNGFSGLTCTAGGPAYAGCRRMVIPIINNGGNCDKPIPTRPSPVGFANAVITGVNENKPNRSITIVLDCNTRSSQAGGCANFGFPPAAVVPVAGTNGVRAVRLVK